VLFVGVSDHAKNNNTDTQNKSSINNTDNKVSLKLDGKGVLALVLGVALV